MLRNIISLIQLRSSTGFLLKRHDDRLLEDIGLTRNDLENMHIGITPSEHTLAPTPPAKRLRRYFFDTGYLSFLIDLFRR